MVEIMLRQLSCRAFLGGDAGCGDGVCEVYGGVTELGSPDCGREESLFITVDYTLFLRGMHIYVCGQNGYTNAYYMSDFRNASRRGRRQAVDGILNAPVRRVAGSRSFGRPQMASRGGGRTIGNFRRAEGFHSSQAASAPGSPLRPQQSAAAPDEPSVLRMNLPPGAPDEPPKKRRWYQFRASRRKQSGLHKKRKIALWVVLAALALVLAVGGFLAVKGYIKLHKVFKGGGNAPSLQANVNPSLLRGEGDGRINILLMGKGGAGHDGADLTDTMLLVSIDPITNKAALVSVPRDLWVSVPGYGSMKINAVYANAKARALRQNSKDAGGAEKAGITAAEKQVQQVLDEPIHYYGMVDFKAFQQAVDTVGGVTINVPEALVDYTMAWENNGNPVLARQGVQSFDGYHALMYVRSRHGSARGDFDRTERQRLFLEALSQKVLSAGTYTNPAKISGLMSAFGDHVATDMSINDAVRLTGIGKAIGSKIASLDLADAAKPLVKTGSAGGQSVVLPAAGLGNYRDIQKFVHANLRDGYLAKENAVVAVLNGSGKAGLAGTKADELAYYGYNVGTAADAPAGDYPRTELIDLTKGKDPYTKSYLEKRFGIKATTSLPANVHPGNTNFVIILGKNEATASKN